MTPSNLPRYRVAFVTGDYSARQTAANRCGAALYIEGHANSSSNTAADYAMCVVSTNASETSKRLAAWLALAWGKALDVGGDRDTDVGYGNGYRVGGAGDRNLRHTDMPAVLCEPCFCSNRTQSLACETDAGLTLVASILVEGIRDILPAGSLIAFSVGHIGKTSQPHDRGARWRGKRFGTEAEFASAYLHRAAEMLRNGEHVSTARTLRELRLLPGDLPLPRPLDAPPVSRETEPAGGPWKATDPHVPGPLAEAAISAEAFAAMPARSLMFAPPGAEVGEAVAAVTPPAVTIHLHLHGATGAPQPETQA